MNQKGSINLILILLIILVVALAGTVGYLTLVKKASPPSPPIQTQPPQPQQPPQQPPEPSQSPERPPQPIDWESLIPDIRTVIGPFFLGVRVEEPPFSFRISQEADITGDGIPEALVYLGTGGAYTESHTLMRIKDGKPMVAQFKQKDGKTSPLMFLEGASVMNGESAVMLPDKNAIYAGHWSRAISGTPFGSLTNCSLEAYQWNSETEIFDFNPALSDQIRPEFCQKVERGEL